MTAPTTSLQELLDIGHQMINFPMSICNARGWDYAMTSGKGSYIHPNQEEFTTTKNSDSIKQSKDKQSFLTASNGEAPFITYSPAHKCNVLFANIWIDGLLVGAIVAYEQDTPFTVKDLQVMNVFRTIITFYTTINQNVLRSRSALSEYLVDLLEDKPLLKHDINKILKYPNWKANDEYIVLCVKCKHTPDIAYLTDLCDTLEDALCKPQAFLYNSLLIGIINMKNCCSRTQLLQELSYYIDKNLCYWGLSHEFFGISNFTSYYEQAHYALQQAEITNTPYRTMREVAKNCIQEHMVSNNWIRTLIHPDVPKLIAYDVENRSRYSHTLYWFLFYSCNYTDAANQLSLHRNTLIYRINRIQEIITCNFMDPIERELLLLSFMLYRYDIIVKPD
ncbi:Regulator of polyketide synthase expression [Lachnospiraceae bacterium TWA4]|nr:Regulator of polyketide synthase expression [Lachnospiraceae bacterium TWA4]